MADQRAFVLRIAPSGRDWTDEALEHNELIIGWAEATGLLDESLDWNGFREIIKKAYHSRDKGYRSAGSDTGNMWNFIRGMRNGDLVVVPHSHEFYVAEVTGPARHDPKLVRSDTAYRRPVKWLNKGKPIPRKVARAALISRMKDQHTCVGATDLIPEINEVLRDAAAGRKATFDDTLRQHLIEETLKEIHTGHMDNFRFEQLVAAVLKALGGRDVHIVPRKQDKGADVLARFNVARQFSILVAVQAKWFQKEPPAGRSPVEELVRGMDAEGATLGLVVTSGTFSEEAEKAREEAVDDGRRTIELVDGEQLAAIIVDNGLGGVVIGG